jgi:hypothetical protein
LIIYLADNPPEAEDLFVRQATEIMKASPSMAPYILAIQDELSARQAKASSWILVSGRGFGLPRRPRPLSPDAHPHRGSPRDGRS